MRHFTMAVVAATTLLLASPARAGFVPGAARAVNAARVTIRTLPAPWQTSIAGFLASPTATRGDLTAGLQAAALQSPLALRTAPPTILPRTTTVAGSLLPAAAAPGAVTAGVAGAVAVPAGVREALQAFAESAADPVLAARKLTELELALSFFPGAPTRELAAAAAVARAELDAAQSARLQASLDRHHAALGGLKETDGVAGPAAVAAAAGATRHMPLARWTGERESLPAPAVAGALGIMSAPRDPGAPVVEGALSRFGRAVKGALSAAAGFIGGAAASLAAIGGLTGLVLLAAQVPVLPALAGAGLAAAVLGAGILTAANLKSYSSRSIADAIAPARDDASGRVGFLTAIELGWTGVKGASWIGLAFASIAGVALFFTGAPLAGAAVLGAVAAGATAVWLSFNANTAVEMIKSTLGFVPSYMVMAAAVAGLFTLAVMGGLTLAPALAAQLAATVGWAGVPGATAAALAAATAAAGALGVVVLASSVFSPRPISEMIGQEDDFKGFRGGAHRAARYAWGTALTVSVTSLIAAGIIGALLLPSAAGLVLLGGTGVATLGLWARSSPYTLTMTASGIASFIFATAAAVGAFAGAGLLAAAAFPLHPVSAFIVAVGAVGAVVLGAYHLVARLRRDDDLLGTLGSGGSGALSSGAGAGAAGAVLIAIAASLVALVALAGLGVSLAVAGSMSVPLATVGPAVAAVITGLAFIASMTYLAINHPHIFWALLLFNFLSSNND